MRKKDAALRAVQVLRQAQDDREGDDVRSALESAAPLVATERAPLPAFTPVPRRYRHDGSTPERQKLFIEALADTGCVTRAAGMVNMAQANCNALRRALVAWEEAQQGKEASEG